MILYQAKIEDDILPQEFTLDKLLDAGLLDDYDPLILIRAIGDTEWHIAREYPFAMKEGRTAPFTINEDGTVSRIL